MVQIQLFGGVSAVTGSGEQIDVGPAKSQALLAALALSAGSAVPVSRLVEMVWGADPPRTADKTLQSYVARLRKGLGPDSIKRSGAAYLLAVDPDSVDAVRFQRSMERGEVEAALEEWTGEPLAGLDAPGLRATVDGLVEQWLGAVESDLGTLVERDASVAIGPLTELTSSHPLREGLWALLMTALYRVGRQADALDAYRRARHQLVEQLGVEPGPRLRELESLILDQDEQLSVDGAARGASSGLPNGTVTFAFADVEGATRLWASHRHEMAKAVTRADELVRTTARDRDGYIFNAGGDSFGIAFHRARDASGWATDLKSALSAEQWPGDIELRFRVGLHTGETEDRGKGYFGPAVNLAARVANAGHGGQVLVSGATSGLLDQADLRELGLFRLTGVVGDQRIFQLGPGDHPPLRTEDLHRGNLPRRIGRLIGRDDELEIIAEALTDAPLVTLVGPGGIGKTTLALAAARIAQAEQPVETWLIELAEIASSLDVSRAVADTLDVELSSGRSLTGSIVSGMGERRALLLLDNCEHVIEGAAELAAAVAEGCPEVRILATSREGLGLRDEQLVVVAPLDPAGSGVELFNERARAASRTFDPESNAELVAEICRRLDGVPLAIELAAARTRSLSPADLVERLDDRLRLLTGGRRTSLERHRTLRTTIQWSYDLLTSVEQMLFRRLSIFAGPFDLAAAETVAADEDLSADEIGDILGDLVERSMLIVEPGPFGRRFRLLETMRQFGAEDLSGAGNTDLIAARHANWCLEEARRLRDLLAGRAEVEGVARLGLLWPNLRAAVDWAEATGDHGLLRSLIQPVAAQGFLRTQNGEICDWAERLLAMTPSDDSETIALGLMWAAFRYMLTHDREGYVDLVDRHGRPDHPLVEFSIAFVTDESAKEEQLGRVAVREMQARGETQFADLFEVFRGGAMLSAGRLDEAEAHVAALAERFGADGPPTLHHWALFLLGFVASFRGEKERAEGFYEQSASVAVPDRTHSLTKSFEARSAFRRGDRPKAYRILRSHIDETLEIDNLSATSFACIEYINMMVAIGDLVEAARMLGHLDTTGIFEVEGRAFATLVEDSSVTVDTDPEATAIRGAAAEENIGERQVLVHMRDALTGLLSSSAQAS